MIFYRLVAFLLEYDETHTLERSYENLVTDGILADTLKPIDNAFEGDITMILNAYCNIDF
jgi:hypothetical protein